MGNQVSRNVSSALTRFLKERKKKGNVGRDFEKQFEQVSSLIVAFAF
jgi:hypothetical protein